MTLEDRAAALSQAEIVALLRQNEALAHQAAELQRQVEWFKRQLFGRKSERRLREPDGQQLPLAGLLAAPGAPADTPPPPTETVKAYQRRTRFASLGDSPDESGLRFDPSVPVEVIAVPNPDLVGLSEGDYEVIGEKVTYRLAQRPGAYVLLKYVRPVIKRKDTETLSCPLAPPAVLEKSRNCSRVGQALETAINGLSRWGVRRRLSILKAKKILQVTYLIVNARFCPGFLLFPRKNPLVRGVNSYWRYSARTQKNSVS